jgi:aryl-alcohol dehydrogenase-like predicted oxidoreductase
MINKLIFGTASLTNISDYNKIINLLECTYDHGIINYDTAPLYGKGYAEIIVGNFLKNKKNINISTKFGLGENFKPNSFLTKPLLKLNGLKNLITKTNINVDNNFSYCKPRVITKKLIQKSLNKSLKNLKCDRIENYLLHEALPSFLSADAKEYLIFLKKEQIIKKIGIASSYNDLNRVEAADLDFFDILQYDANELKINKMKLKFPLHTHFVHSVLKNAENKSDFPDLISQTIKHNNLKLIFSTRNQNRFLSNISKI